MSRDTGFIYSERGDGSTGVAMVSTEGGVCSVTDLPAMPVAFDDYLRTFCGLDETADDKAAGQEA